MKACFLEGEYKMIQRIWHGWTTPENADSYEALLNEEIFVGIQDMSIPGLKHIRLIRRENEKEVEFITLMTFDSLESVRSFAGEDYEQAYIPDKAKLVLARYDERAQHYEIRADRSIVI